MKEREVSWQYERDFDGYKDALKEKKLSNDDLIDDCARLYAYYRREERRLNETIDRRQYVFTLLLFGIFLFVLFLLGVNGLLPPGGPSNPEY
jgi:hypothetical protein